MDNEAKLIKETIDNIIQLIRKKLKENGYVKGHRHTGGNITIPFVTADIDFSFKVLLF